MRKIHLGLLPKILLAILLGILASFVMPAWMIRLFVTFNGFFGNMLSFAVPLIIVALVTSAIADTESGAGKMLVVTFSLAYISTITAGFVSYFTSATIFPHIISSSKMEAVSMAEDALTAYFTIPMPPLMDIMSSLVLSFLLGLGIFYTKAQVMHQGFTELKEIISKFISGVIIPLLPLYIFGLFLSLAASGEAMRVIMVFIKIIGFIFVLHILWLVFLFVIAGISGKKNPWRLLKCMLPAYLTALATQSSVATLPVTLRQAHLLGADEKIADFVVPLCANIHLSGSILKIVSCALALMIMQGHTYSFPLFAGFIFVLAITVVAAPGVPGGVIMASLSALSGVLGFTAEDNALMISVYIAMDNFGTACNVTGDGALTVITDAIMKRLEKKKTVPVAE